MKSEENMRRICFAFLVSSWLWLSFDVVSERHHCLGLIALSSLLLSGLALVALILCFDVLKARPWFNSVGIISVNLPAPLILLLCLKRGATSDTDGLHLSSLCNITLITPFVLYKMFPLQDQIEVLFNACSSALVVICVAIIKNLPGLYFSVLSLLLYLAVDCAKDGFSSSVFTSVPLKELNNKPKALQGSSSTVPLSSLVANTAHDLKTPLASFMVGVDSVREVLFTIKQLIEKNDPNKRACVLHLLSSAELCLSNCKKTNEFMMMTINRFMDSAKSARGLKLSPKYETVYLLDAIKLPLECVQNLKQDIKSISLEPIPDEICRNIITDKQWLQENLLCLLTNAVKYSMGGSVVVRTSLVCSHFGSTYIRFEVEDEGIGMDDVARASLFNAFQQNQRLAGGTGLGLFSLSKRIDALKGKCGVQKRRDGRQGSLFWFTFRYRPDETDGLHGYTTDDEKALLVSQSEERKSSLSSMLSEISVLDHSRSSSESAPQMQLGPNDSNSSVLSTASNSCIYAVSSEDSENSSNDRKSSVLLVDDTLSIIKMTSMMLKMNGFDVITSNNGAAALDYIESCYALIAQGAKTELPFDVVLMDLQMPIMDGIEATKRLRSWESEGRTNSGLCLPKRSKRLKVIGLSANNDEEVLEEIKNAGFDGFIAKPFTLNALRKYLG